MEIPAHDINLFRYTYVSHYFNSKNPAVNRKKATRIKWK